MLPHQNFFLRSFSGHLHHNIAKIYAPNEMILGKFMDEIYSVGVEIHSYPPLVSPDCRIICNLVQLDSKLCVGCPQQIMNIKFSVFINFGTSNFGKSLKCPYSLNLFWILLIVDCDIVRRFRYLLLNKWQTSSCALVLSSQPSLMKISIRSVSVKPLLENEE